MSTLLEAETADATAPDVAGTGCAAVDDVRTPVNKYRATQTSLIPDCGGSWWEDQRIANKTWSIF
jgi:hypothetical protein